jgi:Transglycosylase SLT domain
MAGSMWENLAAIAPQALQSLGQGLLTNRTPWGGLGAGFQQIAALQQQQKKDQGLSDLFSSAFSKWNPEQQQIAKALIASGNQDAVMQLVTRDAFPTPEERRKQAAIDAYINDHGPIGDPHNPPVMQPAPASGKPQSIAKGYDAYKAKFDAAQAAHPDIPVGLLPALGQGESTFDPNAVGPAVTDKRTGRVWHAKGIGQFSPDTAALMGIDPFNPDQAIPAMGDHFSKLLQKYNGDVNNALADYGGGVDHYGNITPNGQKYAEKMLSLARLFGGQPDQAGASQADAASLVSPRVDPGYGPTGLPQTPLSPNYNGPPVPAAPPVQAAAPPMAPQAPAAPPTPKSITSAMDAQISDWEQQKAELDKTLPALERHQSLGKIAGYPDTGYTDALAAQKEIQGKIDQAKFERAKFTDSQGGKTGKSFAELPPEDQKFVDHNAQYINTTGDIKPSLKTGLARSAEGRSLILMMNKRADVLAGDEPPAAAAARIAVRKAWQKSLSNIESARAVADAGLTTAKSVSDQIIQDAPTVLANTGFKTVNGLIMAGKSELTDPAVSRMRTRLIETGTTFARIIAGQQGAAATPQGFIKLMQDIGMDKALDSGPAATVEVINTLRDMAQKRVDGLDGEFDTISNKIAGGVPPQGAQAATGNTKTPATGWGAATVVKK